MPDAIKSLENLNVYVTVLYANQLPDLKTWGGDNRKFYVIDADARAKGKEQKETKAIRSVGNAVAWNEKLGGIPLHPSSQLTLFLYAKHQISSDIHVGTVNIDPQSVAEISFTIQSGYNMVPSIVLTIDVHGSHHSDKNGAVISLEDANSLAPIPNPLSATRSYAEAHIIEAARGALENTDTAVIGVCVYDEWEKTVQNVQWVMVTMRDMADIHPYAKFAWTIISAIPEVVLKQFELDGNIRMLVKTMRETFDLTQAEDLLKSIKPNSNQALILKVMLKHITICSDVIQRYAMDKEFWTRLLRNISGGISDEIGGLCNTLTRLRQDLVDNSIITMQIAVDLIQKNISIMSSQIMDLDIDAKMNDLPYKSGWSSTANKSGCLEGTRADFLEYILEWIKSPSSVRGLMLFGRAGTGKSSIAFEIASRFCFDEHPGSYFSFSRAQRSAQKDHHLFTTIIRDMADRNPSFKLAIGKLITNNTPLRTSDDFDQLFNTLILEPLATVGNNGVPELIVIDALDESADPERLASFLSRSLKRLPHNIRVFITSRSEGDIEVCFPKLQGSPYEIHQMDGPELTTRLEHDIRLYFQTQLSGDLFQRHGEELVKKAERLFQWAAVACGYLNKRPAGYTEKDCLRGLLGQEESDKPYVHELQSTKLYKLYDEVLSGYFTSNVTRPRFRSVMGHLLGAFEPLSVNTLTCLRQFIPDEDGDVESVLAVVKFMGSLLSNVTSHDRNLPIVPLHTSFRDFLVDKANSHSFYVNLGIAHWEMICACLNLMLDDRCGLKFNICRLESSHLRNTEVEDLQSRIDTYLSPPLLYACRFWDDHLTCVPFNDVVFAKVDQFFSTKFLFWLEVLSITKAVPLAVQAMNSLVKWLPHSHEHADRLKMLMGTVMDGLTFLRSFGNIIAQSAPHIYVSALPFAPTSSEVYKIYSSKFPATLSFKRGQLDHWPVLQMSITASSKVLCVDISSDGHWIASGMDNGVICLWNATTGIMEGSPFIGHTQFVLAIAFSSDGRHIISGSYDRTIRLWNVVTGMTEGDPWTGHEGSVRSVAFSPNGQYAVSSSSDNTVRVWNVVKGSVEGFPITGHTGEVSSVTFSPDGKMILSGSHDFTVRLWAFRIVKGQVEVTPLFTLQTASTVWSVAFSPNGRLFAAGCYNTNVYLWDTLTEPTVAITLKTTESVCSVKFSPDGRHIVSGSDNGILLVWNTDTKMAKALSLITDVHKVPSVAFSSDGQRIVSGAYDQKIHLWNAVAAIREVGGGATAVTGHNSAVYSVAMSPVQQHHLVASSSELDYNIILWNIESGSTAGEPLHGHSGTVNSIAFSPNGQQLISASNDRTLRLWNVEQGIASDLPFTGHTDAVRVVAFSANAQRIVSGSDNGEVFLWDIATGTIERNLITGCSDRICSVDISPDGRRVVAGSDSRTGTGKVWLWDVLEKGTKEGHQSISWQGSVVVIVAFSSNGEKIISCSKDNSVCLWNSSTGDINGTPLKLDYIGEISSVSLSSDGSLLAVAFDDYTIILWNLVTRTRENIHPLIGHIDWIGSLSFSPDGRQLVSGSADCTIRVWNISMDIAESALNIIGLSTVNEEGWIYGQRGELLLWIPQVCRTTLQWPSNVVSIFASYPVHVDFSEFVHGQGWYNAYPLECQYA